jgi:hypothetical protein
MTETEIALLKALAGAELVTFMPEDTTAAALTRFKATVESLREMQKAGWVELEVAAERKRRSGGQQQILRGAAARCTEAGRAALEDRL